MKRKEKETPSAAQGYGDIVFQPALTPIEAAALPAREVRVPAALHSAKAAWQRLDTPVRGGNGRSQRTKIWVR